MAATKPDTTVLCRRCARHFHDVPAFDAHRHGRGPLGGCTDPALLRDRDGYLAMERVDDAWRIR